MKKSPPLKGGHLFFSLLSFALGARATSASLAGEDVAMTVAVVVTTVNARSRLISLVATLVMLFVVWLDSGGCGGK